MPDITILGAGIFGLSIAWACQSRGASVRIIDPLGPGGGASGGLVGALAPHVPENWNEKKAFQLESLLMAGPFWAEVETVSGLSSGYARRGRIQPLLDARSLELAHARQHSAKDLWAGHAEWQVVGEEKIPFAVASPTGFYVLDTLSACLHPRKACYALAKALQKKSAEIVPDGPQAGIVVHATGVAGLEEMSRQMGLTIGNAVKGQAALLDFEASKSPQIFVDGMHVIFHEDGTTAIGSTSERLFTEPTATDALLEDVIRRAKEKLPVLAGANVIERWAGLRPRALSRAPMLGAHPVYSGQFIANGGFKIGFGMAPKVGQVMANLMLESVDSIPVDFRPEASLPKG